LGRATKKHFRGDAAWVSLVVPAVLGACSLVYDAGDFAASPDAAPPPDPCLHAGFPPRVDASDGPDGPSTLFVARELSMVVGDRDTLGFDLDGRCTCDERPGAPGGSICAPRGPRAKICDDLGGRDNAGAKILGNRLPDRPGSSFDVGYTTAAETGTSGLLFALSEYNGRLDDPEVRVEAFDSPGLDPEAGVRRGRRGGRRRKTARVGRMRRVARRRVVRARGASRARAHARPGCPKAASTRDFPRFGSGSTAPSSRSWTCASRRRSCLRRRTGLRASSRA
jgi:hypothetical protein